MPPAVAAVLTGEEAAAAWRRLRATTWALCALVFLAAFESLAVTTVMPTVSEALDGASLYALAFAAPLATGVVGMVVAGAWADRAGPARPLAAAAGLFVAGLVVAGTAVSMEQLAAGRLLQGLGGGSLTVVAYVVVARLYPGSLHPRVFAGFSAAWVVPSLVGPPVAGFVAEHLHWRWVFLAVAVLVPAVAAVALHRVRTLGAPDAPAQEEDAVRRVEPPATGRRIAWASLAAVAVLALGLGAEVEGRAAFVVAALGVTCALVALRPLVPHGTLHAARGLPAVVATRALLAGGFFAAEVYLPYLLTRRYGIAASLAGVTLTAAAIAWAGASWLQGRLGDRLPHTRAIRIGTATVALAIAATAAGAATHAPVVVLVVAWATAGFGMGLTYARQTVLVLRYSAAGAEGANSSALSVADSLGAALALSVTGVLFGAAADRGGDVPYAVCLTLTAVLALAAALVAPRVAPRAGYGPGAVADPSTSASTART
ncbi:MFS transporter [Cellulomonas gilvus]|uniref:Major facilitator superfamily MFS_1 n=1 Tax=Cellulomonas gilvus (strain ATCC 13127 / NRRL B-14078) TaxID=593907 RepID=F7ZZN5_CELGA|nr:MFS transporter [Cellulomonas gilvus]AEI12528.1 major facilitator superfamily MFS_1 [Cellulomonas gilvus ATCC 13127]